MADEESRRSRIVFMGTPQFAAVSLQALVENPEFDVAAVYTQPDRPCGRGRKTKSSAVKQFASNYDIHVEQPTNFKDSHDIEHLKSYNADFFVVVSYGLILSEEVLNIPKELSINVHASLLPKYRGAAPIQRAVMAGETVTGITIMQMDVGMDTGPILRQRSLAIGIDDTSKTIHDELAVLGGQLLVETLRLHKEGRIKAMPQNHDKATYAAKLQKSDGNIDFSRTALEVHNHIRGVTPWPGAYIQCDQIASRECFQLQLSPGKIGPVAPPDALPGSFLGLQDGHLAIACSDRFYLIPIVCPEHRKWIDAQSFVCGYMKTGSPEC